jgi:nucleotide-binding universal stress UspA family protein
LPQTKEGTALQHEQSNYSIAGHRAMSAQGERTWSALVHLSMLLNLVTGFLGPVAALVVWLVYRDRSPRVAFHALQSMWYQVAWLVILAAGWILTTLLMVVLLEIAGASGAEVEAVLAAGLPAALALLAGLAFLVGLILFGAATMRAGVFPRLAGLLLIGGLGAKSFALYLVDEHLAFHGGIHYGKFVERLSLDGREATGEVRAMAEEAGAECEELIVFGRPDRSIFTAIEELEADPIFFGDEGMSGLEHALMGSVCEEALRHANTTALVIGGHPDGEGPEEGS